MVTQDKVIASNGSDAGIVLSLSAGGTAAAAEEVLDYANMYRIAHDWHGSWGAILTEHFPQAYRMSEQALIGARGAHGLSWPDHGKFNRNLMLRVMSSIVLQIACEHRHADARPQPR